MKKAQQKYQEVESDFHATLNTDDSSGFFIIFPTFILNKNAKARKFQKNWVY